jgi:hypothetical protein
MIRLRYFAAAALSFAAVLAAAQEGGDLQAQILYAYHSEDTNELNNLVQSLTTQVKAGGADAALRYHLAHADYRYGLLLGSARSHDAVTAFDGCIDQLKEVLEHDVKSAEALALESACYGGLANHKRLEAVLLRSRQADRLAAAFAIAPNNPRVLYLKAMDGLAHAKPGSEQAEASFKDLERAAKLFDESSATREDVPGWGHAECYLALGIQLQARNDQLAARNWIEKALIVAPNYKAAQRQLAGLVRH